MLGEPYNPLALMFKDVLKDYIRWGFEFFVRQSYPRGITDPRVKEAFLITPYKAFMEASVHFDKIKYDKRKLIYRITDPWQQSQLYKAALQPEGYLIFIAKIQPSFYGPEVPIRPLIQRYIEQHSDWRPEKVEDIKVTLSVVFGEIFVEMEYESGKITKLLDTLEAGKLRRKRSRILFGFFSSLTQQSHHISKSYGKYAKPYRSG